MALSHRFIVAGKLTGARESDAVTDKYTGRTMARVAVPGRAHVEQAIAAGVQAEGPMRALPAYQRGDLLHALAEAIARRRRNFERLLCTEAGKPLRDSRGACSDNRIREIMCDDAEIGWSSSADGVIAGGMRRRRRGADARARDRQRHF